MHAFVYMICKSRGKCFPRFNNRYVNLYITFIKLAVFMAFLTSENDIICTVTLHRLPQIWRVIVRYKVQKELCPFLNGMFSLRKTPFDCCIAHHHRSQFSCKAIEIALSLV